MQDATTTYGTVAKEAPGVAPRRSRRTAAAAVALLALGVVAVLTASQLSSHRAATAVDANKMKAKLSPMIGVAEKAVQLLNQTSYGIRYVVIRFNKERSAMMPVMQGASSNDWELDFTAFTNAMKWTDELDPTPSVGLYAFPYWTDEDTVNHQPLVITYVPPVIGADETARYGYFLGSLLLATDVDKRLGSYEYVALSETAAGQLPTYQEFCESALKLEDGACELDEQFHNCPWDEGTAGSPCDDSACMGATFEPPNLSASGTIPTACCDYVIDDFCKQPDNMGTHGCHPALLRTFGDLCAEKRPDEVPVMLVPASMVQNCESDCAEPCAFFDAPHLTWQKCAGCATDGVTVDPTFGQIAQCHPKALDFEKERCCGIADECGASTQLAEECAALDLFQCEWATHMECDQIDAEQQAAADKAAAAAAAEAAAKEAALKAAADAAAKAEADAAAAAEATEAEAE